MNKSKTEIANKATNELGRPERLKLSESRDMLFEKFRTNLRVLRGQTKVSAVELSKEIGLKSGSRITDLEYGRGTPEMEEVILIANYFKVKLDEIIYKEAKIYFE